MLTAIHNNTYYVCKNFIFVIELEKLIMT